MAGRSSSGPRASRIGLGRPLRRFGQVPAVLVAVTLACAAGMPKALADGSTLPCTSRDNSTAFAPWLDPAEYFLASNGGFEQGSDDWTLSSGAAVASGNEPYRVNGPSDGHSLVLPAGATATSRPACVTMGEPTVRLFVNAPNVAGAWLRVDATVRNPTTGISVQTQYVVGTDVAPAGWAPTPQIVIANAAGGIVPEELTLRFTASGTPATWGVDDVFVDPFRQR